MSAPPVEAKRTRSTSQVYSCLGCGAKCGRCARTIRRIMGEALGGPRDPDSAATGWPSESNTAEWS